MNYLDISIKIGSLVVALLLAFFLFCIIMAPKSIKNGSDLAIEYHRVAGNDIYETKPTFFFYFSWWPISLDNRQVLPFFNAIFKRYFFLLNALFWMEIANAKKKGRKTQFYIMAFGHFLSRLTMAALIIAIGFYLKKGSALTLINIIMLFCATIALLVYPAYMMIKYSIPIVKKMRYDEDDKKLLVTLIKWYFVITLIATIYEVAEFALKAFRQARQNE